MITLGFNFRSLLVLAGASALAAGSALARQEATDPLERPAPISSQETAKPDPASLPKQAQGLEVQEHLGATLPMELTFLDAEGRTVHLGDYFPAATGKVKAGELPKPAIIMLGYFGCPVVCPVVQDKMVEALEKVDLTAGKDFNFLMFSFDASDTPAVARGARGRAFQGYSRSGTPEVDAGFAFHTGNVESTRILANALGFPYRKLENGQFSHPVALFVVSPEGVITRYIYGFSYPPTQVKLALMDASQGKLAKSLGDYFMNYCYMYDPRAGKYTIQAVRVMKVGGALTLVALTALIVGLRLSEYLKKRSAGRVAAAGGPDINGRAGATTVAGGKSVTGPVA